MGETPKFEQPTTPEEELKLVLDRSEYLLKHIEKQNEQIGIDHLTGLKTRKVFEHELEQSLKIVRGEIKGKRGSDESVVSLILIDIDHFKRVNDTLGHAGGDEVLRRVSALLMESVRETDIVARVGGEELAILMRGVDEEVVARHAEKLREKIEQMTFDAYPELKITASFGTISSNSSTNPKVLYSCADKALYVAKRIGKNRVEPYGNT